MNWSDLLAQFLWAAIEHSTKDYDDGTPENDTAFWSEIELWREEWNHA